MGNITKEIGSNTNNLERIQRCIDALKKGEDINKQELIEVLESAIIEQLKSASIAKNNKLSEDLIHLLALENRSPISEDDRMQLISDLNNGTEKYVIDYVKKQEKKYNKGGDETELEKAVFAWNLLLEKAGILDIHIKSSALKGQYIYEGKTGIHLDFAIPDLKKDLLLPMIGTHDVCEVICRVEEKEYISNVMCLEYIEKILFSARQNVLENAPQKPFSAEKKHIIIDCGEKKNFLGKKHITLKMKVPYDESFSIMYFPYYDNEKLVEYLNNIRKIVDALRDKNDEQNTTEVISHELV